MLTNETIAALYGVASALTWGAGDFTGGVASRRVNEFTVVFLAQLIAGILLLALALAIGGPLPAWPQLATGALAGSCGVLGLVALYRGLALGRMGIVAPLSAIITALIPLTLTWITVGAPGWPRVLGCGLALAAVWFLSSQGGRLSLSPGELRLSLSAGLGFGLFFVLMDHASSQVIIWPLVAARSGAIMVMLVVIMATGRWVCPAPGTLLAIALAGILDVSGNAAFCMAAQAGRLDISAILSSLYPASTVLLARLFLKEQLTQRQWLGVATAGMALILVSS